MRASSKRRYAHAQGCELSFWQNNRVPVRNSYQTHMFDRFDALPAHLGHVLELGAGPYTKLRLILEDGTVERTATTSTFIDPLATTYMTDAKVKSSYKNGLLCLNQTAGYAGGCIPALVGSFGAETPMPTAAYDTVIMVNTIEHCMNAIAIFENLRRSLRPGGHLVLAEEFIDKPHGPTNQCHPLRIAAAFYEMFLNKTFGGLGQLKLYANCGERRGRLDLCDTAPKGAPYVPAVQHTVYAIGQMPP